MLIKSLIRNVSFLYQSRIVSHVSRRIPFFCDRQISHFSNLSILIQLSQREAQSVFNARQAK